MADTPEPPIRSDADVRSIADMPLDVETIFTFAKEVSLEVLGAAMLLRCWAWRQVPAGSLPDNDEALAAMVGLRRDVWQRVRPILAACPNTTPPAPIALPSTCGRGPQRRPPTMKRSA